jgi:dolichol-phosphate mannosyltransferase
MLKITNRHYNRRSARRAQKVFIVLPAFNEELRIGKLLDRIDKVMFDDFLDYSVIVVDDGSTDRTAEIIKQYIGKIPVIYQEHKINVGLGGTIRDGLHTAMSMATEHDIIVTMDSDDTHTPGLILRMVHMIREGYDVIIASRYQHEARVVGVPLVRRLLSSVASLILRCLFPIRGVKDYTCGYRAYRAVVLQHAHKHYGARLFDQDGFQCMVDILLKLRPMHLIFGEVPFVLRYDCKEGGTKMKIGATIKKTLVLILKRRLGLQ